MDPPQERIFPLLDISVWLVTSRLPGAGPAPRTRPKRASGAPAGLFCRRHRFSAQNGAELCGPCK
eukprot:4503898-Alexandrium_andersonii.AAC.1